MTHSEIITAAGHERIKDVTGVSIHTVRSWVQRGSIPAQYWASLAAAKVAKLTDLAASAPARKQKAA